MSTTTNNINNN